MRFRLRWVVIGLLVALSIPASAAGEEKPLWEAGIGAAVLNMPDYRGSDERRTLVLPYPYLIYRGDMLRVDRERISGRLFKTDKVLLDFSLSGHIPVDSSDNAARSGMPDLDPVFEVGPSLSWTLLEERGSYRLGLNFPVRAVFSTDFSTLHHEGWVFHPRLVLEKTDFIPGSGVTLGISAGPMFADRAYHRYFYAVEPSYATVSRPVYDPGSGYSGTTLTVGLNKKVDPLLFNAFVSVDFLKGAVFEDSPLVREKTSLMAGFSVSWIFLTSERKVQADR
jgi:outer membrane scaffolding protein for murein synthesis (MipA/OmpV family)